MRYRWLWLIWWLSFNTRKTAKQDGVVPVEPAGSQHPDSDDDTDPNYKESDNDAEGDGTEKDSDDIHPATRSATATGTACPISHRVAPGDYRKLSIQSHGVVQSAEFQSQREYRRWDERERREKAKHRTNQEVSDLWIWPAINNTWDPISHWIMVETEEWPGTEVVKRIPLPLVAEKARANEVESMLRLSGWNVMEEASTPFTWTDIVRKRVENRCASQVDPECEKEEAARAHSSGGGNKKRREGQRSSGVVTIQGVG
ncbi:hypothetical protein B0H19DRAFT_1064450 [Mycena capillaripes]|nr:hypothetical protein B0H19DRAFT_1064450 [Mycena capillaripes]